MKYEKESEERGAKRQLLKSKFIGLLKKYYKSSTSVGAHIVNAETGQVYEHLVGSTDECRYYTVMINEGKEGIKLFYN